MKISALMDYPWMTESLYKHIATKSVSGPLSVVDKLEETTKMPNLCSTLKIMKFIYRKETILA